MNKEEKQLLLKDLCSRIPYGVIIDIPSVFCYHEELRGICDRYSGTVVSESNDYVNIEKVKVYLRPMSSMTEEEEEEYWQIRCPQYDENGKIINKDAEIFDWFNAHHFDYRGLIEKGLALEAPEDMYKF